MTETDLQTVLANFNIVCLAGGVGGAKLAAGLAALVPPSQLTIIVNTGDDFQHLGLTICPDLDTVMYTLAQVANPETGWGRAGESWRTMESVAALGGPDWFRLGDLDLGLHLTRQHLLNEGASLSAVTKHLCQQFGIHTILLPMSNEAAPTLIESNEQTYPFQTWFVQKRWQPPVRHVVLPDDVKISHEVGIALEKADIVIFAPSNPFVSIAPILNVYPIRNMIMDLPRVVAAVTPIIGHDAVKGPAAKMMRELGMPVSATAVADYYGDLIDIFVYDARDDEPLGRDDITAVRIDTLMTDSDGRERVAKAVLTAAVEFIHQS